MSGEKCLTEKMVGSCYAYPFFPLLTCSPIAFSVGRWGEIELKYTMGLEKVNLIPTASLNSEKDGDEMVQSL